MTTHRGGGEYRAVEGITKATYSKERQLGSWEHVMNSISQAKHFVLIVVDHTPSGYPRGLIGKAAMCDAMKKTLKIAECLQNHRKNMYLQRDHWSNPEADPARRRQGNGYCIYNGCE
jgi:hypothetical protein